VSVVEGSYLLWFAKFGSLEYRRMDSIEDAVELVVRLRDQSTSMHEYDEYGSADFLERVGHGVVEDFFDRCDAFEEQQERERQQRQAERKRERAAGSGPRYSIYVTAPKGSPHLYRYPQYLTGGLDGEAVIIERDRLESLFGRERITVRQEQQAEAS
jgi:hypothetical protein